MTRCLILDDKPEDASALGAMLGTHGLHWERASGAEAALARLGEVEPELIVIPEARADLLGRIRRVPHAGKVIVYSEKPDAIAMGRHIRDGAAECLVKPFDADVLEWKLRQVGIL